MKAKAIAKQIECMRRLYEGGASLEDVAKRFGMTRAGVATRFKAWGVPIRRQGERGPARKKNGDPAK